MSDMRLAPWTFGTAGLTALRTTLPVAALELPPFRPEAGSLLASHDSFRRMTSASPVEAHATRLFGTGLPLIGNLSTEEVVTMVAAAGVATLLIRGAQILLASKTHPFGGLSSLNDLVHNWAVEDESDARAQAKRLGDAFLAEVKARRNDYENDHFKVTWDGMEPNQWADKDEIRQRLTTRYAKDIAESFRDFARGVSLLSERDWGKIYKEVFEGFLHNVAVAIGPLTRWQPPLNDEDLANFRNFQTILRREVLALEMKLEALSEPHAV
ncbi:MAG TPA: hypothetical protein VFX30_07235 [bacterium]|nr:hypothetical protein [bacterium]